MAESARLTREQWDGSVSFRCMSLLYCYLMVVGWVSVTTIAAAAKATIDRCADTATYLADDGVSGFLVDYKRRRVVVPLSHSGLETIFAPMRRDTGSNVVDCSSRAIRCVAVPDLDWIFAVIDTQADTYEVQGTRFAIKQRLTLGQGRSIIWVDFDARPKSNLVGTFMYDRNIGALSVTFREGSTNASRTFILAEGRGLLNNRHTGGCSKVIE